MIVNRTNDRLHFTDEIYPVTNHIMIAIIFMISTVLVYIINSLLYCTRQIEVRFFKISASIKYPFPYLSPLSTITIYISLLLF